MSKVKKQSKQVKQASHDKHHPIICQIVGRCHVGESNRAVLKYVISRLDKKMKTWRGMPRDERRKLMVAVFECHLANFQLYSDVMTGKVTYERYKPL